MTLEERITRLEDIEAIRQLQAKYQRCLDTRDFAGIASCFTEDAQSAYGNGSMSYNGRDAILAFLKRVMTKHIPSTHLIHGGEIDVTPIKGSDVSGGVSTAKGSYVSGDVSTAKGSYVSGGVSATAHAKWYLEDYLNHRIFLLKLHGAAIYDVDYRKTEEGWKICKIGYTRCYQYFAFRGLLNLLTLGKTTFLDRMKK